jgi:4-hydroxy-tetrahydrodipicolinate reductase
MIRVAVSGAAGRMGREIVAAVEAVPDMELSGLFAPGHGSESISGHALSEQPGCVESADVIVEVTTPEVVMDNIARWRGYGTHVVVGTSGFGEGRLTELRAIWGDGPPNCLVVPNFSIGAVLMMRFAEMAAPHFAAAEVVEMHHDRKADAPSGTALATASRIGAVAPEQRRRVVSTETVPGARGGVVADVRVHSIRLPGLVAHQAVLLGNDGELLTIRHDTTDRASFMPGVLVAIRGVGAEPGVTVGIDHLV